MSSRERVARREAAAIADDKDMMLQVQNGVENDPALNRARLSKPGFTYGTGFKDRQCLSVRIIDVQNVEHQQKRKSQRTSFEKYKCDSKHSPIHGSSIVCVLESLGVDGHEKRRRKTT
ncbi:hypothetical protein K443DRAFT_685630 [Laccaria amethystina LaAM-08-1]|uniref:Uncharacterized protein n=1 Tax=Laccaria amethystina LaAM-08-1 TaxID=1095629 RepID=A0A0C9WNG0_9AGAR|nr:hypothetical protein K443DRAFT_685630 [Laccaria amethystina LaAM-08-1]